MWEPTRRENGEGRRHWGIGGPTPRSDPNQGSHRGIGDGMSVNGDQMQHGKSRLVEARDLPPDAREGQAGPAGVTDRLVVCAGQRFDPEGSSPSAARMRGGVSKDGGNASSAGELDHGEP